MANIILLAVCLLAGIGLRKTGRFPAATPAALNGFIIHISLPALTILHIHNLTIDSSLLLTAGMAWLLFGCSWLMFGTAGKLFKLDRGTTGALILVTGLGNTSFVGLPILVATLHSSGNVTPRRMVRKILLFPPFQALILALLLRPVPFPEWSVQILQKLGSTLTPLALVSVGFQLLFGGMRQEIKPLAAGLAYKLILGPALIFLLYCGVIGATGTVTRVTIFEAAMAPMITAGIIAIDHNLRPQLVGMLVGIGIPLSFITLHIWHLLLQRV